MKLIKHISKAITLLLVTVFSASYGQQISKTNKNLGDWKSSDGKYFLQVYLTKDGLCKGNLDNKQNSLAAPLAVLEVSGSDDALSLTGGGWNGKIEKEKLNLNKGSEKLTFVHYERTSPTMNAAPPKDAIILFNGKNLDQWSRLQPKEWIKGDGPVEAWKILPGGILEVGVGSGSIVTKQMFGDFKLHAEVRLLGEVTNGGIYMMSRYEMNIKDSYGQIGGSPNGAFGNISKPADFYPSVNMAYPPMVWQTFDIEFRAPRFDATGTKKIESARISIVHNGVQTYKDAPMEEVKGATGILGEAGVGPIYLQEHGTAYQFRNIWVVDKTVKGTEKAHTPVQATADGAEKKGGGGKTGGGKAGGGKKNGTGKKGVAESDVALVEEKPAKKKGSSNKKASADYSSELNPLYAAVTVMITPDASGKPAKPAGFNHPGVLVNLAQLEEIKKRVAAGTQPQKTAFEALKDSPYGALGYTPQPRDTVSCGPYSNPNLGCKDEQNDAAAAYTQALLWFITGNKTYAESAIKIMNAWSTNLVGGHNYANGPVQAAWCGSVWPRAAEIIRYTYKGWSDSDIAKFQNTLRTQYLPTIIHGDCENGNKELAMAEAIINIGVFNDDRAVFDLGIKMWRGRTPAYIYLKTDGPTPIEPPGCGPAIWSNKGLTPELVDGLMQETARDSHHPWMAFASMANAAETARQQGVDLYAEEGKRMVAALEYQAKHLAPNTTPAPANIDFALQPTWEIAYNHYHNRMGMNLPYMKVVLPTNRPTTGHHHMLWETLTHAEMGGIGLVPVKK